MKRILAITLACLLVAALFAGCGKKPGEAAPETTAEAGAATIPETDVVRLESIDLDAATGGLIVSVTEGKLAGTDTEYAITYGETKTYALSENATIDFPMAEDLTQSVTIAPGELTEEYLAYVEKFDDKPIFTMTLDGEQISSLTFVYLP